MFAVTEAQFWRKKNAVDEDFLAAPSMAGAIPLLED